MCAGLYLGRNVTVGRLSLLALVGLLACGGRAAAPPRDAPPPAPAPPAPAPLVLRVVRVPEAALHFAERGSGTPVVFVHGTLGSVETWQAQLDTFAAHHRVVSYSRRYHPPNAAQPGRYTLAEHVGDLVALIETLGLERVHLVGTSYGAYVALGATLRRPDLVRSLVLAEPPILPWLGRSHVGDSLRRAFEAGVLEPARAAFARGDSVAALRRFVDGVRGAGRFDGLPQPARAALLRTAFALRMELRAAPDAYMPPVSCDAIGRMPHPVLLVTGERTHPMFRVIVAELARCLAAEETVTVPGAGHAPHADQPAFYNVVVLRFLAKN